MTKLHGKGEGIMLKKIAALIGMIVSLNACTNVPSPQNTTPSQRAQCAALRTQMLQAPLDTNDNTPIAIVQGQNVNTQQTYHDQCE